jgi:Rieske 2Fe-2S family protein
VSLYALREGVVMESRNGKPVAPLMGSLRDRDAGVVGSGIYLNLLAEAYSDHATLPRFTPTAAELTQVEMTWLVNGGPQSGLDYRCEDVEAVWRATAEQDWQLCEWSQQGVNATGYRPGRYARIEYGCDHFDRWYIEEVSHE